MPSISIPLAVHQLSSSHFPMHPLAKGKVLSVYYFESKHYSAIWSLNLLEGLGYGQYQFNSWTGWSWIQWVYHILPCDIINSNMSHGMQNMSIFKCACDQYFACTVSSLQLRQLAILHVFNKPTKSKA